MHPMQVEIPGCICSTRGKKQESRSKSWYLSPDSYFLHPASCFL